MLTYIQVHLYYLFPPILLLLLVYHPLLGRRDVLKILWLCFMATVYTTPWDNWIISQSGWGYPAGSIIARIGYIPLEEHLFFVVQPILLVLIHALVTHGRLVPFRVNRRPPAISTSATGQSNAAVREKTVDGHIRNTVQTFPRRPTASLFWVEAFLVGMVLVNQAHAISPALSERTPEILHVGRHGFYLGWILIWISPVIGGLTWLGGRLSRKDWLAWAIGSAWCCMVDTIAIRAGSWSISPETSLGINVVRGLPLEEFIFFLLTSYLVILATSIICHLHTLLLLSPSLPPCPPLNPIAHIVLLARVALTPPVIDQDLLWALSDAETTLRRGSKSFEVAKLAFGREMRIGLIAIYAWCRVTDNLIDETSNTDIQHSKHDTLITIRRHLQAAYGTHHQAPSSSESNTPLDAMLDSIPDLTAEVLSAFHLFASIIPRLVPIEPFLELCEGYETDMAFITPSSTSSNSDIQSRLRDPTFDLGSHLPIKTQNDLVIYADNVAGSIASAICYLSWSILTSPGDLAHRIRPVGALAWATTLHSRSHCQTEADADLDSSVGIPHHEIAKRIRTVEKSREMGRALQLVNIARDIAKDARIGRLYVPVSSFPDAKSLLHLLLPCLPGERPKAPAPPRPSYAPYTLRLLVIADELRESSEAATGDLPRTARGGARAMSASYFEIGRAIRDNAGEVNESGVKVDKWKRVWAAVRAIWWLDR